MEIRKLWLSLVWILALSCDLHLEIDISLEMTLKVLASGFIAMVLVGDQIK